MLRKIIEQIRSYEGLTRKQQVGLITDYLRGVSNFGNTLIDFGDDAAVLKDENGYLLLAADGIWPKFLLEEPYQAGKASVMVNVNDIYAMGGRPLAMVNVIASAKPADWELVMEGIRKGCEKFRVPMVGGHFHPDVRESSLSVAILGRAKRLLTSHSAKVDDNLVLAIDLDGQRGCKSVYSWDANSGKSTDEVLERLEALVYIAQEGLADTAKDISNAGILGSIGTLLETSKKGALIDIEKIPKPPQIGLLDWLKAYPSFGFVLSVKHANTKACLQAFHERKTAARVIGKVTQARKMVLRYAGQEGILFDFAKERITGIG